MLSAGTTDACELPLPVPGDLVTWMAHWLASTTNHHLPTPHLPFPMSKPSLDSDIYGGMD